LDKYSYSIWLIIYSIWLIALTSAENGDNRVVAPCGP